MNKSIIKKVLVMLCVTMATGLTAQQKLTKTSQTIKVDKDVVIDLNTSDVNIVIDTWNKKTVSIEAFVESNELDKQELEDVLNAWDVDVDASNKNIAIYAKGTSGQPVAYRSSRTSENGAIDAMLRELEFELAAIPEVNFNIPDLPDMSMLIPELPEMPAFPALPELPKNAETYVFDYERYKKDGDKYIEEYSKRFEKVYGEDYAQKMEAWGEEFGKEWGEKYGKQMEAWAKQFEKKMESADFEKKIEAWGEKFGKQMEAWGERYAAQVERSAAQIEASQARKNASIARQEAQKERAKAMAEKRKIMEKERAKLAEKRRDLVSEIISPKHLLKAKKTIIIKMPKDAKLKVNVKHGEIQFATAVDNLKADLTYTKLTANSINGGNTSINASYSPIHVANWQLGELNLNYVKDVTLKNVNSLVLNANSSNVAIENLNGAAIVDANIGDLTISNITDAFSNLNLIIQNMDAHIALPKIAHNLRFKGTKTKLIHPENHSKANVSNFSMGDLSSGKSIMVNAKYSSVLME